ncbi:serine/threonine protein kinase [Algoriphagus iocasae]|uniref:Serine/threonine protein kinase n=1 Tax=Algoriphagus iocasae TaxID=1836499 RepID=A0A841MMX5_9BACT|nr:AarF/UbiB family protein [Algoriphagus iocasae]MBB6328263.1 serine/threonine protein kinase [Algoriphagus iocasae]
MEKYCCFLHPKKDYSEKELKDFCPECGNPYGFPLFEETRPTQIGEYKVLDALERGYYGATYIVEKSTAIRTQKRVLKVVPKEVYRFFGKDFQEECRAHAEAAEGTQHIVDIDDIFEDHISFGDTSIECHVAILQYVKGKTLKHLIASENQLKATAIGQIAIDLLKVLSELESKKLFHNDLHPGNIIIEELEPERRRLGELDDTIKAVAIDFGSLASKTQSGDKSNRVGDLHRVAITLDQLSKKILDLPGSSDERDYRLASLLEERAKILLPSVKNQRTFEFSEIIDQIKSSSIQVSSPWKAALELKNFRDSYNAQTMLPWFVPSLLVDDDDRWISRISSRGPLVITGMRGCGKTMLLRALQFHARAIPINETEKDTELTARLEKEGYLGLYVSCTRLLDSHGLMDKPIHQPFPRLFLAYAIEAISAIKHLRELNRECVRHDSFISIAKVVAQYVEGTEEITNIPSEHEVEVFLKRALNSLSKGESKHIITANPAVSFPVLAQAIRECSEVWNNSYVFFLLDDVSTRFLNDDNIIHLVSTLLFQDQYCAFKFTTEMQTLEMVINSPGNIEQAREGRDYDVFDLGNEVNEKVHANKSEGTRFVEKILLKRSKFHSGHPKHLIPSQVLGDATLKSIAENIARKAKASDKKGLYHGITAIASVCVGDIGDIITLYDMILNRNVKNFPVSREAQNECYLDLCNSRLYHINRRESRLYDFAESFAKATHHLLVQSYKAREAEGEGSKLRLRQYSSIFINITTGNIERQYEQVRELIDAGIFNFSGGPEASRTNRQGVNPQQQFKLVYRKLYGVTNHIGLSNADRFELSGEELEDWLNNPKKGKDILIRNLKTEVPDELPFTDNEGTSEEPYKQEEIVIQTTLWEQETLSQEPIIDPESTKKLEQLAIEKLPILEDLTLNDLCKTDKGLHFIAGLGFEERTLESLHRWLNCATISQVDLIEFKEAGNKNSMIQSLDVEKLPYKIHPVDQAIESGIQFNDDLTVDITGLPKAVIFNIIRTVLNNRKRVNVVFTEAEKHYPLEEVIKKLLEEYRESDHTQFLESLTDVLKGESGPYKLIPLMPKNIDNYSSRRVLIAFSSPKHERLFTLLDEREYDKIHIIVPSGSSPQDQLARIAAHVAIRRFNHAEIVESHADDLKSLIEYLAITYQRYFVEQTFSFEIALTGSKIQTVASASICSSFMVSQVWYVQPKSWDPKRFTEGTKETSVFSLYKN